MKIEVIKSENAVVLYDGEHAVLHDDFYGFCVVYNRMTKVMGLHTSLLGSGAADRLQRKMTKVLKQWRLEVKTVITENFQINPNIEVNIL